MIFWRIRFLGQLREETTLDDSDAEKRPRVVSSDIRRWELPVAFGRALFCHHHPETTVRSSATRGKCRSIRA